MSEKKTIFIPITRGFIARNVLRSGGYVLLREAGFRIVLLFPMKEIPQSLKDEFAEEDTILLPATEPQVRGFHRLLYMIANLLIFTDSTKRYLKYGNVRYIARSRILTYAHIATTWTLSKIPFLRTLLRNIERRFLYVPRADITKYFNEYKPDIVFCTSINAKLDIELMKEARHRGITSVAMPRGWDNVTRHYYRVVPDYFLVQNEIIKTFMQTLQDVPEKRVKVIGFPQFDWYRRPEILRTREEHLPLLGLDSKLPLVFFGSEGMWADSDYHVAEKIYSWIVKGELAKPCQLLVRPHFTNIFTHQFGRFEGKPLVAVDHTITPSKNFIDHWDPSIAETIELTNTVAHCDVLVTTASTLNLDATCMDKPVINLAYGAKYRGEQDITPYLHEAIHMQWVAETKGTDIVRNESELKEAINVALLNPSFRHDGRQQLLEKLCDKVDGESSKRMVDALVAICSKSL